MVPGVADGVRLGPGAVRCISARIGLADCQGERTGPRRRRPRLGAGARPARPHRHPHPFPSAAHDAARMGTLLRRQSADRVANGRWRTCGRTRNGSNTCGAWACTLQRAGVRAPAGDVGRPQRLDAVVHGALRLQLRCGAVFAFALAGKYPRGGRDGESTVRGGPGQLNAPGRASAFVSHARARETILLVTRGR